MASVNNSKGPSKKKASSKKVKKISVSDIQARAQLVKDIYREYSQKLDVLDAEQKKTIADFLESAKNKRLKELREEINGL